MRAIKFRAWDKEKRIWLWQPDMTGTQTITDDGKIIYMQFIPRDSIEIMQYTGLKDKNGVEIYEGDILNMSSHFYKGVVKFGRYQRNNFSNHDRQAEHQGFFVLTNKGQESLIEYFDWEVIGNIYETPELLEEDK